MDDLLLKLLGSSFSKGEVLQRQSLGTILHIFSHIRMTLLVERLVLKVRSDCVAPQGMEDLRICLTALLAALSMVVKKQHPPCKCNSASAAC